jgi:hypothetical protein
MLTLTRIRDFFIESFCNLKYNHNMVPFMAYYFDEDGCHCEERFFVCKKCGKII